MLLKDAAVTVSAADAEYTVIQKQSVSVPDKKG